MKNLQQLKEKDIALTAQIDKINGHRDETDRVAQSFHMGRVGGSGRNTARLNSIRERSLDRVIDNAVKVGQLTRERDEIRRQIKDQENDGPAQRAAKEQQLNENRVKFWEQLKPGDKIPMGNSPVIIAKKNKKSFVCTSGIPWTAAEIIGKSAAALIK